MNALHRILLTSALVLAQVGAIAAPPKSEPIRVGSVSSLTGPGASSDAWRSAKAYFDAINAAGGVRGRRIDYTVLDDRMDPAAARQAAEKLVADPKVVALGGGSSVLECAVNHARYAEAGIMSLPGGGVDPMCFRSPQIAPVNAGPYVSTANALTFARQVRGHDRICVVAPALPGMSEVFQATVAGWSQRAGGMAPPLELFKLDEDLKELIPRVARHQCKVAVYTGPEGPAIDWIRLSRSAFPKMEQIVLTSAYTTGVQTALGALGDGVYAMAEFEPWSSRSLQTADWRRLMVSNKIEPSSLSQGGYLAAQMLVKAMFSIQGEVTRESVTRALKALPPVQNALSPDAFVIGMGDRHNPNRSALPLRLQEGRWRVAHSEWIRSSTE